MLDKTYTPAEVQAKFYKAWEGSGAFECDPDSAAAPYTIMMPPPNVTGSLHMGHAFTFTLQDILVRYHRMLAAAARPGESVRRWRRGLHAGVWARGADGRHDRAPAVGGKAHENRPALVREPALRHGPKKIHAGARLNG